MIKESCNTRNSNLYVQNQKSKMKKGIISSEQSQTKEATSSLDTKHNFLLRFDVKDLKNK